MTDHDLLVRMTALALLNMEKIIMDQLAHLNAAVAAVQAAVGTIKGDNDALKAQVAALMQQIADLQAQQGVDPASVEAAASALDQVVASITPAPAA